MKKPNMNPPRVTYTEEQKLEAMRLFVLCGNASDVCRQLKIPFPTMEQWKTKQWWKDGVRDIRNGNDDLLDVKLTNAIDSALSKINDRIENGDQIYDPRTGDIIRVPAKLRDLTAAFNSVLEKRQIVRKQPTKITQQISNAQQLQDLAQQFAAFVSNKKEPKEALTLEQDEDGVFTIEE